MWLHSTYMADTSFCTHVCCLLLLASSSVVLDVFWAAVPTGVDIDIVRLRDGPVWIVNYMYVLDVVVLLPPIAECPLHSSAYSVLTNMYNRLVLMVIQ